MRLATTYLYTRPNKFDNKKKQMIFRLREDYDIVEDLQDHGIRIFNHNCFQINVPANKEIKLQNDQDIVSDWELAEYNGFYYMKMSEKLKQAAFKRRDELIL